MEAVETPIIGGGQAGPTMSHALTKRWRSERWDGCISRRRTRWCGYRIFRLFLGRRTGSRRARRSLPIWMRMRRLSRHRFDAGFPWRRYGAGSLPRRRPVNSGRRMWSSRRDRFSGRLFRRYCRRRRASCSCMRAITRERNSAIWPNACSVRNTVSIWITRFLPLSWNGPPPVCPQISQICRKCRRRFVQSSGIGFGKLEVAQSALGLSKPAASDRLPNAHFVRSSLNAPTPARSLPSSSSHPQTASSY
jgi:hypothetical protein